MTSHRNTASLFDAAEFPQNEEAGESDECEVAEGKAPAGYRPGYPPYGGQYAARAQGRSPASIAQAMLGAHNVIRVRVGCTAACLVGSTRPSGARLGSTI